MATTPLSQTAVALPPPAPELPSLPPPPNGQVLALLAALSNPSDHDRHAAALRARDDALCASPASYGDLCRNFGRVLACPSLEGVPAEELNRFRLSHPEMHHQCCGWIDAAKVENISTDAAAKTRKDGMMSWAVLRQMAGLLLKNALVSPPLPTGVPLDMLGRPLPGHPPRMILPPDAAAEIKHSLLRCVADADPAARSAASTAIARACFAANVGALTGESEGMSPFAVSEWKELVPFLLQCISCGDGGGAASEILEAAATGALLTLRKLLEDVLHAFEHSAPSSSFHDLVPALLRTLASHSERRRREALACLNCLVEPMPGSLVVHMNDYLAGLSALASDPSVEVRQLVCRGIVNLLFLRSEYLAPHVGSVAEFMLRATSDTESSVALEACEFWLTFASLDEDACTVDMMGAVSALLPRLVPQLLRGMVYPPEKIEELMETNALEEGGLDREDRNIAPVFHKNKMKGQQESGGDQHDDDDSDDDDDDDDNMGDDNEWTLRKCSAASLDALSGMFGAAEVLPPLLPALQEGLGHTDQWVREASILALGAIADGCRDDVAPHLPQLHPFLLAQLSAQDSLPQLRCIAAWTLVRYASWTVDQAHAADGGGDPSLVGRVAEALVGRLLDRHRKVQIAVCSALGVFVESSAELMAPFLEPIYQTLMQALSVYRTRSLLVLFDTLGVVAEFVGSAIGEGPLPGIYVPPLLKLWNDTARQDPFDRSLLPLVECLASCAVACGMNYQPWALETFEMAMSTVEACTLNMASEEDVDDEMADPVICAADLVDALVEGMGPNFAALVAGSARYGEMFPNVLVVLAGHDASGVRMSAFALLGDLARHAPQLIATGLSELLLEAIGSIDPMHPNVCNNAVWAVGEVCVRCGENPAPVAPHAPDLVQRLVAILMGNATDVDGNEITIPGLAENAAIAMGRLANVNPGFVAPDLGRFLTGWTDGMAKISNPNEKRDAFWGFVVALRANPQSISSHDNDMTEVITGILFAVVSWHMPKEDMPVDLLSGAYGFVPFPSEFGDLAEALSQLLRDLKLAAGEESWNGIEGHMPVNVRKLMRDSYHI